MDKLEAAKIMYGDHPEILNRLEMMVWMDKVQDWWRDGGNAMSWKDDALHAVWWSLHALVHNDPKAIECAHAYLSLAKRGNDESPNNG